MSFEDIVADGNSNFFFKEFTYSSSLFKLASGNEVELCDGAVWIDNLLFLYQLKQRNPEADTEVPAAEKKWFEKKVEKLAVGQFSDTVRYLQGQKSLPLLNCRGQPLDFSNAASLSPQLIVLYDPSVSLPLESSLKKGRVSKRVGFVHYFHISDYRAVCMTLHTPFEIAEYLIFRAAYVERNIAANKVSEKAMLGRYFENPEETTGIISDKHEHFVDQLIDDRDDFNISKLLRVYVDRIKYGNSGTEYHVILKELAKLQRNMLREFRKRLNWAMETCRDPVFKKPSRFYPPKQECCFLAIPIPISERGDWRKYLEIYTHLCKYDLKSRKCVAISVSVAPDDVNAFLIHWMYLEYPWKQDDQTEKVLKEDNPFRETFGQFLDKYHFR